MIIKKKRKNAEEKGKDKQENERLQKTGQSNSPPLPLHDWHTRPSSVSQRADVNFEMSIIWLNTQPQSNSFQVNLFKASSMKSQSLHIKSY